VLPPNHTRARDSAHRAALLDLLVAWAEASPAVAAPAEAAALSARVAISSVEHDRVGGDMAAHVCVCVCVRFLMPPA
jgi:hypothetical protein